MDWTSAFFERRALEVAPEFLGCFLGTLSPDGELCGGLINEVEAYEDDNDPASHAHGGVRQRNRPMYGKVGCAYVYFIYGNHFCFNLVCHPPGRAGAVLVRSLIPTAGQELMLQRRGRQPLSDGPGKLCQALAIDRRHNEVDLLAPDAAIALKAAKGPPMEVRTTPRIGIRKAVELPWRFLGIPQNGPR